MASYDMHWEQGNHNQNLVNEIVDKTRPTYYRDWAITIAFYAAIHYVEAFLERAQQCHSDDQHNPHQFRVDKVYQLLTEAPVGDEYRNLLHTSIILRYLSNRGRTAKSTSGKWLSDDAVKQMAVVDLGKIKNSVTHQLNLMSKPIDGGAEKPDNSQESGSLPIQAEYRHYSDTL